jgi:iron-sulfur cluster assembly protein
MAIQLTEQAAARIREQLAKRGQGLGLRLGVKASGCSGYSYTIDYADQIAEEDRVFESHGARVVVDPRSLPVLDGTTLDFKREGLNQMFRFLNPNVKDECGCGESFSVETPSKADATVEKG